MSTLTHIRKALLALLAFGTAGTGLDLFLIEHYETALRSLPLVALGIALVVLTWHAVAGTAMSVRILQTVMVLFVATGLAGMALHFQGGAEFQLEIDPTKGRWDVFTTVIRNESPPVLASGVMVQLGLLGLVYSYRHPALGQTRPS